MILPVDLFSIAGSECFVEYPNGVTEGQQRGPILLDKLKQTGESCKQNTDELFEQGGSIDLLKENDTHSQQSQVSKKLFDTAKFTSL